MPSSERPNRPSGLTGVPSHVDDRIPRVVPECLEGVVPVPIPHDKSCPCWSRRAAPREARDLVTLPHGIPSDCSAEERGAAEDEKFQ